MNNEEKILGLLEKVYIELQETKKDLKETKESLREEMKQGFKDAYSEMRQGFKKLGDRLVYIENDHGKKLSALFDGYKQNSDKLDRIEAEVSKHEEIILRRVR